ncbi:phytoene dehydrogenase-like protein [Sphingorhabdus rigui]|uniref:Phytoene dehydrogenase-like protein n=1 Tax=Sphingorhabdus rigui TaxID=1282858 RepID=A0A840AU51_9SPHN|nr:phytoene dehydrogenase-like protein [Sphingorhabdus rigui]
MARCAVAVRMLLVGNNLLRAFVPLCEPKSMKGAHKGTKAQRLTKARHAGLVSASTFGRSQIKTLKHVQGDDAALLGKPSQILPTCGEVATHGVDGGGWQFTRGGMRALTPPSTTLCVVPLPVNEED